MSTVNQSGSQTATISTEHTLGSAINTAGQYLVVVDAANMANGDVLELRAKRKARSGDTAAYAFMGSYSNVQAEPVKISVPVPLPTSCALEFTLKQTAGTGRAYPWSIESL